MRANQYRDCQGAVLALLIVRTRTQRKDDLATFCEWVRLVIFLFFAIDHVDAGELQMRFSLCENGFVLKSSTTLFSDRKLFILMYTKPVVR